MAWSVKRPKTAPAGSLKNQEPAMASFATMDSSKTRYMVSLPAPISTKETKQLFSFLKG